MPIDALSHNSIGPYVVLQLHSDDGIVSWDKCYGVSLASMVCHFELRNAEKEH